MVSWQNGTMCNSNLWVKLPRICYAKILIQAYHMTHKFDSEFDDLAVCKYICIVTFALPIPYTYSTVVDATVKKD